MKMEAARNDFISSPLSDLWGGLDSVCASTSKSTLGKSTDGQIRSLKELWRWAECKGSDLFPVSS